MALPTVQTIVFEHLASLQETHERSLSICSRASSAGKCSRAIAFQISGLQSTNPPGGDSLVNFYIGDAVHDLVQGAIQARWPDAQTEVFGSVEDYITGHLDVLYSAEDGAKVVCEIKSVSDFAFELATGAMLKSNGRWRKKERVIEGPKREHLLQVGIYALMQEAPYLAIVYVRKTAAKDEPVTWEWRFKASDYYEQTVAELERQRRIVEMVRNGRMPDREFEGKIITNPNGVRWPCGYCDFKAACVQLGAGEVKII